MLRFLSQIREMGQELRFRSDQLRVPAEPAQVSSFSAPPRDVSRDWPDSHVERRTHDEPPYRSGSRRQGDSSDDGHRPSNCRCSHPPILCLFPEEENVSNNPGCCVCGTPYKDKSRAMQKSTQQPSYDYERNADDCKHPVQARRGWRLRASTEGRRDFRLPSLPHADDHQQDNDRHGAHQHHEWHRNHSIGQRNPPRH